MRSGLRAPAEGLAAFAIVVATTALLLVWSTSDAASSAELQGAGFDWWASFWDGWTESGTLLLGALAWIVPTVVVTALRPRWTAPARAATAMVVAAALVAWPAVDLVVDLVRTDGFGGGPAQLGVLVLVTVPFAAFFVWGLAIGLRVGTGRLVGARTSCATVPEPSG